MAAPSGHRRAGSGRYPTLRGGWLGLNWGHGPAHLYRYRSVLEAIAYDQALNLRAMRQLYPAINPDRVKVSGGGARSALWNQIKADVIGLTHERMHPDHMAAVGTALIAGRVWASSRISLRPRGGGPTS